MKLTELEPRWLSEHLFVFRCPHCRKTWLSCKSIAMSHKEQFDLFRAADLDPFGPHYAIVPMKPDVAWKTDGRDFSALSVTPSIDASAAGHWHGFITKGEIT